MDADNCPFQSPFRVVEMALEMQVERIRVMEVLKARDVAVGRLADAYTTVRRYSEFIDQLQQDRVVRGLENLKFTDNDADEHTAGAGLTPLDPKAHIAALEATIKELREINGYLKEYDACEGKAMCDPPPHYEENLVKASFISIVVLSQVVILSSAFVLRSDREQRRYKANRNCFRGSVEGDTSKVGSGEKSSFTYSIGSLYVHLGGYSIRG